MHGAVIFKGNRILGIGYNKINASKDITEMRDREYYSLHAEYAAIKNTADPVGANILIVRVLHNGSLSMSFPCQKCLKMLQDYGIRKVYYSNYNGEIECLQIKNN